MKQLFLWGAGGHGKVVLDIAVAMNRYAAFSFLDDDQVRARGEFCGCPVVTSLAEVPEGAAMVIAIGSNQARARCAGIVRRQGRELATLVHPSAVVSPSARLGAGTVVMPRAVVNAGAEIGDNCIINTAAVVEHDCRIADHVHLSPGVLLGGGVVIEPMVHMGLGSVALPGSVIEACAVVGAGAVVLRAVSRGETVIGVPARSTVDSNRQTLRVS